MEKDSESSLRNLDDKKEWTYYKEVSPLPENMLGLNVCTLDFKVHVRTTIGELPEDRAFHELVRNTSLINEGFVIRKEDILPYLEALEEATGGKGTFRHFKLNTNKIRQDKWNLKFLNLYLNPKDNETFIVCDRFSRAIRYKEIIPSIMDCFHQDTNKKQ